jgi:hypothetical protein
METGRRVPAAPARNWRWPGGSSAIVAIHDRNRNRVEKMANAIESAADLDGEHLLLAGKEAPASP